LARGADILVMLAALVAPQPALVQAAIYILRRRSGLAPA